MINEKSEYLRNTCKSLRAGRRELHTRIRQYLEASRSSTFNHSTLFEHEQALSDLDGSIDDWNYRLERSEYRGLRVRQKLLEHLAASALLSNPSYSLDKPDTLATQQDIKRVAQLSTPPGSPSKQNSLSSTPRARSSSPHSTVPPVSSTVLDHSLFEQGPVSTSKYDKIPRPSVSSSRTSNAESIKVYASNDVFDLMFSMGSSFMAMEENSMKGRKRGNSTSQKSISESTGSGQQATGWRRRFGVSLD